MRVKRVDGLLFEKMLRNGLENIRLNETKVNNINVFPVPDGDTGSNMRMTLENGIKHAKSIEHMGEYLNELAEGMLFGARGNSGVILSQLFRGFAEELRRDSVVDAREFAEGFRSGYKSAYRAVVNPTEGTLLTVSREGAENAGQSASRGQYINSFFAIYVAEMKKSLSFTPELLPSLKEAGVVDSGGLGYITIVEGMLKYLKGEIIDSKTDEADSGEEELTLTVPDASNFTKDSEMNYGYCTEFILQLLNNKEKQFEQGEFIDSLKELGESIVVAEHDGKVKVHIHTKTPGPVIDYAQQYGEFISFKLENMELQNSEFEKNTAKHEHKKLAKIAITNGIGLKDIYKDLGCDIVIEGGRTMNTSSEEIIKAIKQLDADCICIFPNSKNIEMAADQAVKTLGIDNAVIIKSQDVLKGYYALAMDVPDSDNIEYRIAEMKAGLDAIATVSVFKATRTCEVSGIRIHENDYASISDGNIMSSSDNFTKTLIDGLRKNGVPDDKNVIVILKGVDFSTDEDELTAEINANFPGLEIQFMDGGQLVYDAVAGLI